MKTWLRLTLVTVTVGGGFTGIVVTLQSLFAAGRSSPQPMVYYFLMLFFSALFAFITISGLIFVHDAQKTEPILIALALQIPWVSSPLLVYKFTAGFEVCVAVGIVGVYYGGFNLGSVYQFGFLQLQAPWGCGVNLFALTLLALLIWSRNKTRSHIPMDNQPPITGLSEGKHPTDGASSPILPGAERVCLPTNN